MKRNNGLLSVAALVVLAVGTVVCSCSKGVDGDDYSGPYDGEMGIFDSAGGKNGPGAAGGNDEYAGVVTAGEWNDLEHWDFWSKSMQKDTLAANCDYWSCYTNHRVALLVTDESGQPLAGIPVRLLRQDGKKQTAVWETTTDNHGQANCWLSLWQKSETVETANLRVSIDGRLMEEPPVVSGWSEQAQPTVNRYVCAAPATVVARKADIAFVVDATGSMGDEIGFLKSDLLDILGRATDRHPDLAMRTAALFYRDEGDDYLTRHSDFSANASATINFIQKQQADGGGDYPEAVHTALERMLQDLSWDESARTRLAFLILDAPAHHETHVISSLQKSVTACARQGIRLVPVAASGVDKNTEFMLRFFAITTGGTYVFLTNDSGVGNDHIEATVGDYEVEQLNELMIRLIDYYTE